MATYNRGMTLGRRLAARLTELNWTATELARHLDVAQSTVSRWIDGEVVPADSRVPELAAFLEQTPAEVAALLYEARTSVPVRLPAQVEPHQVQISSADVDLAALSREDPEAYAALMELARVQLERARQRKDGRP